jgi:tetratricopeptide (TPR) repeat protein
MCTDPSLEESYNNTLITFNRIVSSNKNAEDAISCGNYHLAADILHKILAECVDYSPAYLNLARIYYSNSEIDKAFEYTKKANYYTSRLRVSS